MFDFGILAIHPRLYPNQVRIEFARCYAYVHCTWDRHCGKNVGDWNVSHVVGDNA